MSFHHALQDGLTKVMKECKNGTYRLNDTNPKPIPVSEFVKGIGKFKALSDTAISEIQHMVDARFELLKKLSES